MRRLATVILLLIGSLGLFGCSTEVWDLITLDFTATPLTGYAPLMVTFAVSDSSDVFIAYNWDFGDNTYGYGTRVTHLFSQKGYFSITLTVTTGNGSQASRTKTIAVLNPPPIVDFDCRGWSKIMTCDGSRSFDPGLERSKPSSIIISPQLYYQWFFDDGFGSEVGSPITHKFLVSGNHTVILQVTDPEGAQSSLTKTITVHNGLPHAKINWKNADQANEGEIPSPEGIVIVPRYLLFDCYQSSDPDDYIKSCTWDFGDNTPLVSGSIVSHIFPAYPRQQFRVLLTVYDAEGAYAQDVVYIRNY